MLQEQAGCMVAIVALEQDNIYINRSNRPILDSDPEFFDGFTRAASGYIAVRVHLPIAPSDCQSESSGIL